MEVDMEVSFFTFRCSKGHVRRDIQLGMDADGDLWLSFVCSECQEEVMTCIKVADMYKQATGSYFTPDDLKWLKEFHTSIPS